MVNKSSGHLNSECQVGTDLTEVTPWRCSLEDVGRTNYSRKKSENISLFTEPSKISNAVMTSEVVPGGWSDASRGGK